MLMVWTYILNMRLDYIYALQNTFHFTLDKEKDGLVTTHSLIMWSDGIHNQLSIDTLDPRFFFGGGGWGRNVYTIHVGDSLRLYSF